MLQVSFMHGCVSDEDTDDHIDGKDEQKMIYFERSSLTICI